MSKGKVSDYEVGYGKPPRDNQFIPGQSGFKGHKKKKLGETEAEIIARVRDQKVTAGGQEMTMFEVAARSVINQTIKSGKPRDLKLLFELLDKYGAISETDEGAKAKAGAEEVVRKIFETFDRHFEIDLAARDWIEKVEIEEVELVIRCAHCGPELRRRWRDPDYRATSARYCPTGLHSLVKKVREGRRKNKRSS